jgi:ABC-type antimicrobial peptide transport system permease subunit
MNALERQIALQHPKTDAGNEIWVEPVRHQAQRNDVLRQILRYGMRLILAGEIAGCGIALLVMQFVSGVLYGVSPRDPWTFSIVVLALTGVALVACYIPARRAMRVDPMVALRCE